MMLGWYALAAALVCAYAAAFPLWRAASATLGPAAGYAPVAAAAALLVIVVWRRRMSWWLLALGVAAATAGFLLCDPRFPAKRIHVPEYFVLAIVLRLALRSRLSGIPLMLGSAVLAALFGVYDELIQGLLPQRRYGSSDIAVNALGGLAGAATASAVRLFGDGRGGRPRPGAGFAFGALCLAAGIVAFAIALGGLGTGAVPAWTVVPLAAGILAWVLTAEWETAHAGLRHAGRVAVLLALGMSAYPLVRPPAPPNVIVLTMESARAEVLSPEIMPHIWAAAQNGTRFTQHRAVSAWTAANIVSLLTGASPLTHNVLTRGRSAQLDSPPPLRTLHARGWRTAGIQPFMLTEVFGGLGLEVAPAADPLPWMAAQARTGRPFFLWYHYLYTHLPYGQDEAFRPDWPSLLPPGDAAARARVETVMRAPAIPAASVAFQPGDRPAIRALYLGGFRAFDVWFAKFRDFLDRSGLASNTIVVLTADHAEELLERGLVGHASTTRDGHLHEEIVRVPLVIWLPERMRAPGMPAVVSQPTDHLDVMPTIMRLLGIPAEGRNLLRPLEPRPWFGSTSRAGFMEDDPAHVAEFRHAKLDGDWKLMLAARDDEITDTALYDLARDPGETKDLARTQPERVARMTADVMTQAKALRGKSGDVRSAVSDAAAPRIVWPPGSGTYRYDDLAGRFRLEWSGRSDGQYVIQYEAGSGMLAFAGDLSVSGTAKDFGAIDRRYWNTWVVPYETFNVRVGVPGRDDLWSEWLRFKVTP